MKTLLSEAEIAAAVERLGRQIAADYAGKPLTLLGVLHGSLPFLADLMRQIEVPHKIGLVQASSYRGTAVTPGEMRIDTNLLPDVTGREVVLVDDIFDTGLTLTALTERLAEENVASVRTCVLLWKDRPPAPGVTLTPDYHAFRIPDNFVVGYGLDHNDEYRHLPYIGELSSR
ncbi:MAG: hypoxanthine phosphoribosyltransferase [Planctomycetota bacterium]